MYPQLSLGRVAMRRRPLRAMLSEAVGLPLGPRNWYYPTLVCCCYSAHEQGMHAGSWRSRVPAITDGMVGPVRWRALI